MDAVKITEKQFEEQVKSYAQLNGWLYYHTHRSQHSPAGFPDCVMVRSPRIVYAELKREGKQPSAEQSEWLETLASCPQNEVYLWTPPDWDEIEGVLRAMEV